MKGRQVRTYRREESVVFLKTTDPFGGLSNMAGGYPLVVNEVSIRTSEALYQACRFPHLPDVQKLIIEQASPMTAKMKSKKYRGQSRPDWMSRRVSIMRWSLHVKLAQHPQAFGSLLLQTGDRPIVEQSHRDDFWGARPIDESILEGSNVLGRLLMHLREVFRSDREQFREIQPLQIADFLIFGEPIAKVGALSGPRANHAWRIAGIADDQEQGQLFD